MDKTVEHYMEWMKNMANMHRIHLGSLEKISDGLVAYLEGIVQQKDFSRAQEAKNSLAFYNDVLTACEKLGAGFMLHRLRSCLAALDKMLVVSEAANAPPSAPKLSLILSEANWSIEHPVVGRIKHVAGRPDLDELVSLRGGYFGTMIYLVDTRPSVGELFGGWPDKNSVIVSGEGGWNSEEMIMARSERIPYINGAGKYFSDLLCLEGKLVKLLPSSPTRIEHSEVAAGSWLLPKEIESWQPIKYINVVVTHPKIREMAYAYLAWCVEGSEAGTEILEQLKPLMSTEGYQQHTSEARLIPRKDYPEGYKLQKGNEFIRALARFAAARERRDFDYALSVAKAFPCEPLAQVLMSVLSEDKRRG